MKTVNQLTFGMRLVSADLEAMTGKLKLTQKQAGHMTKYGEFDVIISRLLRSNIRNGRVELGKYYESANTSSDSKENPFQLIRCINKYGQETYILDMVYRKPDTKVDIPLPTGGTYPEYRRNYWRRSEFKRWRNRVPRNTEVNIPQQETASA